MRRWISLGSTITCRCPIGGRARTIWTTQPECLLFFFKQKTAYEISECDWSPDVCSSDRKVRTRCSSMYGGLRRQEKWSLESCMVPEDGVCIIVAIYGGIPRPPEPALISRYGHLVEDGCANTSGSIMHSP